MFLAVDFARLASVNEENILVIFQSFCSVHNGFSVGSQEATSHQNWGTQEVSLLIGFGLRSNVMGFLVFTGSSSLFSLYISMPTAIYAKVGRH